MPTSWSGTKTLSANFEFSGYFWLLLCFMFVGFMIWWLGWGPKLKSAGENTFKKEFAYLYEPS